jgi:hypothetical protein
MWYHYRKDTRKLLPETFLRMTRKKSEATYFEGNHDHSRLVVICLFLQSQRGYSAVRPHISTYLLSGMSLFFSTQLRYTLMWQFTTSCKTDRIGPTFWAPRDTGSTTAAILNAGCDSLWGGSLITLKQINAGWQWLDQVMFLWTGERIMIMK